MDFCKHMDSFSIGYSRNNLLLADQKPRNRAEAAGGAFQREAAEGPWCAGQRETGLGGPEGAHQSIPALACSAASPNICVGQPEHTVM